MKDYSIYFNLSPDLLCAISFEGRLTQVNPAWEGILGWAPDELCGRSFFDFVHPEDLGTARDAIQQLGDRGVSVDYEIRLRCKSGNSKWVSWRAIADLGTQTFLGSARDITNTKLTEERLLESQRLLSAILNSLPVAVFAKDIQKDFEICVWNHRAEELFGLKALDVLGKKEEQFFPKSQVDFFRKKDLEAIKADGIVEISQNHVRTPKELLTLRTRKVAVRDASGTARILLGISEDITADVNDYQRLLQDITEVKERLSIAISAVKFGVWDWNFKANTLLWDDFMYDLFGISKSSFSGAYDAFEKCLIATDAARVNQELQTVFSKKQDHFNSEFRIQHADGSIRYIRASAKCFYDAEGKIEKLIGVNWDDTERKHAAATLIASAKMASLGEMAGGIAHEINNPLAIIYGKANQIRRMNEAGALSPEKLTEEVGKIAQTSMRIHRVIKGLHAFARNSERDQMQQVPISQIIDDTLELCQERFRNHSILLEVTCEPEISLECRPAEVAQVLMNLLNNAHDAVENLPDKWVKLDVTTAGNAVRLTVTDSGHGIPAEVVEKMMHPFFTTKEVGRGTGLGLSIAQGIAQAHQGDLRYDSSHSHTRFVLDLPLRQLQEQKAAG